MLKTCFLNRDCIICPRGTAKEFDMITVFILFFMQTQLVSSEPSPYLGYFEPISFLVLFVYPQRLLRRVKLIPFGLKCSSYHRSIKTNQPSILRILHLIG